MERQKMFVRNRYLIGILMFLLLFMPYSTFVLQAARHYLEVNGFPLGTPLILLSVGWKELILAVLGISAIAYTIRWRKLPYPIHLVDWLMIAFMLYGVVVGGLVVGEIKPVVFGIRYDFAVLLFYFVARFFRFDRHRLDSILKLICTVSVPMLVFALAQVTLLPHTFLERFGYSWGMRVSGNPLPPYHFINEKLMRAMSTFPGPNSLAMYAVFLLLVVLFFGRSWLSKTWWTAGCICIAAVLLVTYSRGHLASLLVALSLWAVLRIAWVHESVRRMQIAAVGLVVAALSFVLFISVARMPVSADSGGIQSLLLHNTSSEIHRNVRMVAWESIKDNPFGTGLGTSGLATTNTGGQVFNPESWYVQITQELGWPGLALALAVVGGLLAWMSAMYHTFPDPRDQKTVLFFIVSFAAIAVSAQFLPSWFEVASISWWVLFGLFMSDYDRSFGVAASRSVVPKPRLQVETE